MARLRGIANPFRKSPTTGHIPEQATDDAVVQASIEQIISVLRGEWIMRPLNGSRVRAMIFENNDALLRAQLSNEIRRALREQEKRIRVESVNVQQQGSAVSANIVYRYAGRLRAADFSLDREEGA